MFNHVDMGVTLEDLKAQTVEGKRVYAIGEMFYPSISTICSFRKRKSIAEWRARVGEEEANKISVRAASAGTTLHSIVEDYLNNNLTDATLADAIDMTSINPSRLLGVDDRLGSVEVGKEASLTLFRWNEGDEKMDIVATVVRGKVVYQA